MAKIAQLCENAKVAQKLRSATSQFSGGTKMYIPDVGSCIGYDPAEAKGRLGSLKAALDILEGTATAEQLDIIKLTFSMDMLTQHKNKT